MKEPVLFFEIELVNGKPVSSSQDSILESSSLMIPTLGLFKTRHEGGGSCEISEYKTLLVIYNFSSNQLQFAPTFNAVFLKKSTCSY